MTFNPTARTTAMLLAVTFCVAAPLAHARPDAQRGHRHGPPPEAFEACEGQEENAACSFPGFRGEDVEGICIFPPDAEDEETLVCAPEGGPPHQRSR